MSSKPNPQGKGLVPLLHDVSLSRAAIPVPPKRIDQVAGELFTSMFVLESEFSFKPVVGKEYYLYWRDERFRLSLVSPGQWLGELFGRFVGKCVLERDITWTIELGDGIELDLQLMNIIQEKKDTFDAALEQVKQLGDILPVYSDSLPYYQRLFASALASSLGISMQLSGIKDLAYDEACVLLDNHS